MAIQHRKKHLICRIPHQSSHFVRLFATCVVVIGLISISAVGRAQTALAGPQISSSGSVAAGQAYGVPVSTTYTPSPATFPLTRYDSRSSKS